MGALGRVIVGFVGAVLWVPFGSAQTLTRVDQCLLVDFSDDGRIGIGSIIGGPGVRRACTWTGDGGIDRFGLDLTIPGTDNDGAAISGDGSTYIGYGMSPTGTFRYRGPGTYERISPAPGWPRLGLEYLSRDGSAACGVAAQIGQGAPTIGVYWTPGLGARAVGLSGYDAAATGISGDGLTVCGHAGPSGWTWSPSTGTRVLEALPGTGGYSTGALGISRDGHWVVGYSGQPGEAVLWHDGAIQALGPIAGYQFAAGTSVSDGGTVIVGNMQPYGHVGFFAFIWTESTGPMPLADYVRRLGITMPGEFQFDNSWRVTADGRTLFGTYGPDSYVIRIPEPWAFLSVMGMAALRGRRRPLLS